MGRIVLTGNAGKQFPLPFWFQSSTPFCLWGMGGVLPRLTHIKPSARRTFIQAAQERIVG